MFDTHTGLQYNRARWYDPSTGRWLSQDPIGFNAGDENLYRYVFNQPTTFTDPPGEIVPLIVIGAAAGANIFIWGNNAEAIDDLLNDRPIDLGNTPYSLKYHKGLVCSTAVGGAVGGATPIIASTLPAWATTTGGLGLAGYGVYSNGGQAIEDFEEGNYFQGTYHVAMAGFSGYGGYQIGRPLLPGGRPNPQQLLSEYRHYRSQGFSPRESRYLIQPYSGMGHHYMPRRWGLPKHIQESPYNVMGKGMSRGCFYERHFYADKFFFGTRLPGGGRWSGRELGLQKPDIFTASLLGLPNQTAGIGGVTIVIVTPLAGD